MAPGFDSPWRCFVLGQLPKAMKAASARSSRVNNRWEQRMSAIQLIKDLSNPARLRAALSDSGVAVIEIDDVVLGTAVDGGMPEALETLRTGTDGFKLEPAESVCEPIKVSMAKKPGEAIREHKDQRVVLELVGEDGATVCTVFSRMWTSTYVRRPAPVHDAAA
ncbi:MAG: hypothetical protein ABIZ50_01090 [Solirubrobacterales bacterium]